LQTFCKFYFLPKFLWEILYKRFFNENKLNFGFFSPFFWISDKLFFASSFREPLKFQSISLSTEFLLSFSLYAFVFADLFKFLCLMLFLSHHLHTLSSYTSHSLTSVFFRFSLYFSPCLLLSIQFSKVL
jgi:hypothetical protein